jgi:hypothetical protein
MGERPPTAVAVGHLVRPNGAIADIPTLVGFINGISSAQATTRSRVPLMGSIVRLV